MFELAAVADVFVEGRLGGDGLGGPAPVDRLPVAALGEALQHGAVGAQRLDEALRLVGGKRADRAQPHRAQPLFGLRPQSRNHVDRERRQEVGLGAGRDQHQAVRLARPACHLGDELRRGRADRRRQTDLGVDLELDPPRHLVGGRGPVPGAGGHVEVRLVQGHPLDQLGRGEAPEDLVDEPAGLAIARSVRCDDGQLGADLEGLMEGHRGPDPIRASLV